MFLGANSKKPQYDEIIPVDPPVDPIPEDRPVDDTIVIEDLLIDDAAIPPVDEETVLTDETSPEDSTTEEPKDGATIPEKLLVDSIPEQYLKDFIPRIPGLLYRPRPFYLRKPVEDLPIDDAAVPEEHLVDSIPEPYLEDPIPVDIFLEDTPVDEKTVLTDETSPEVFQE